MEDELMDAVSARVTNNIRQELEQCFATFENVLDRLAPRYPTEDSEPAHSNKRPAEDELHP